MHRTRVMCWMVSADMGTRFPRREMAQRGVKMVRWLSSGSPLRQGRRGEPWGRKGGTEAEQRPLDQKPQEPNSKEA